MRVIVVSDTHGNYVNLEKCISTHFNADLFIHLGDGENDVNRLKTTYPHIQHKIIHIKGNCDYGSLSPQSFMMSIGNRKIYATHGHNHFVNYSTEIITETAIQNNCDIILFGHTHSRYMKNNNGIYIMNPGSASIPRDGNEPSYGIIDVIDANVIMNIADVQSSAFNK